jgi:Sulfotransferase domain
MLSERVKRPIKWGVEAWALTTSRYRLLPDYLIVGAQRSGTTSLYRYLAQHPNVGAAVVRKGAHWFDTGYDHGLAWYRSHFPTRLRKSFVERVRDGAFITGEGSPYYMFHPLAPARIARHLPEAKLIVLLRNPVDRAYSHHQHEVARGFEHLSFEDAVESESERLAGETDRMLEEPLYYSFNHQHYSYLARGRYAEQLEVLLGLFPRERVLVLRSEDFFANPPREFGRILDFLDLPAWSPRSFRAENARSYAPLAAPLRARLDAYFAEPNRHLRTILGPDFGWTSAGEASLQAGHR